MHPCTALVACIYNTRGNPAKKNKVGVCCTHEKMLAQAHIVGSAQTRAIMERQLAPATTTLYETYLRKFRRWLLQHSSETKDLVTENSIDGARLEAVHVSDFMSEEFDLEHTSAGTYSTCISAVKALLRAQEVPIGSLFSQSLKSYLTGVKKAMADQRQSGLRRAVVGKKPLSF